MHLDGIRAYREAGFDEVYIGQVGPDAEGFFEFYARQVLPRLRGVSARGPREASPALIGSPPDSQAGARGWPGGGPDGIRHGPGFQG